jgi:D-alanyl-D-alanine dipeptidase
MTKVLLLVVAAFAPNAHAKSNLVHLRDIDPTILQEIRYAGSHNFLGRPVKGYGAAECLLTVQAARALKGVQAEMKPLGLTLKVYDCYRPQRAVDDFVAWAKDLQDSKMRREFYPTVDKADLFKEGYIASKSGHSRGSTMDLTLVQLPPGGQEKFKPADALRDCRLPADQRFKDNSIDMGTGYDCFDPLAHTENPEIQGAQKENRSKLKNAMEKTGFVNLKEEWWHYTLKDEPFPNTYFDEPVR